MTIYHLRYELKNLKTNVMLYFIIHLVVLLLVDCFLFCLFCFVFWHWELNSEPSTWLPGTLSLSYIPDTISDTFKTVILNLLFNR